MTTDWSFQQLEQRHCESCEFTVSHSLTLRFWWPRRAKRKPHQGTERWISNQTNCKTVTDPPSGLVGREELRERWFCSSPALPSAGFCRRSFHFIRMNKNSWKLMKINSFLATNSKLQGFAEATKKIQIYKLIFFFFITINWLWNICRSVNSIILEAVQFQWKPPAFNQMTDMMISNWISLDYVQFFLFVCLVMSWWCFALQNHRHWLS